MPALYVLLFGVTALIFDGMITHGSHWQGRQIVHDEFDLWFTGLSVL